MIKKGKIIRTNTALERRYADALEKMASRMTTSAKREIMRLLDKHKDTDNLSVIEGISSQTRILLNKLDAEWESKFIDVSRHMTPRMMRNVLRESKSATVAALKPLFEGKTISLNDSAIPLQNVFKASVNQAVELFRTIPEQYFSDIKGSVMRSITGGGSLKDLISEIDKHSDKTVHRSVNIALDQTRKAYQGFSRNMALEAGVKEGIWVHTGGTTDPRLKHKAFNGKKFNLADGAPVGTMKGGNEYVHPGEEPFCRCQFRPVIEFASAA